jgi:MoaA/NifB/PqqE/SkfB family radical SAM enzyme
MNLPAFLDTLDTRCRTLPLVILYVTEGCNLRCMTCSYRNALPGELTLAEITELGTALKKLGLRHMVYSGGEPLTRKDFPEICRIVGALGVRQTLLTNGLLLEKRLQEVGPLLDEIIVSVDGPDEKTHNAIRGIDSFRQIVRGIRKAAGAHGRGLLSIRTVVQKENFRSVLRMPGFARSLEVDGISFLAADVASESFGRKRLGPVVPGERIMLSREETIELRALIGRMEQERAEDFSSGFIAESPAKLHRIAAYFEALLGMGPFPGTLCNAPMVSAVITSTGELHPCFFLPRFANIREDLLGELLNAPQIRATRSDVRAKALERCRQCVCTLHVSPASALLDRF